MQNYENHPDVAQSRGKHAGVIMQMQAKLYKKYSKGMLENSDGVGLKINYFQKLQFVGQVYAINMVMQSSLFAKAVCHCITQIICPPPQYNFSKQQFRFFQQLKMNKLLSSWLNPGLKFTKQLVVGWTPVNIQFAIFCVQFFAHLFGLYWTIKKTQKCID